MALLATLEVLCVSCPSFRPSGIALATLLALTALAIGGSGSTAETATLSEPATGPASEPLAAGVLAADSAAVDVRDYVFEDEASGTSDTTIALGGTVTWTVSYGDHSITHTLARPLGLKTGLFFDSGYKSSYSGNGDTYTQTFDLPGVHSYYCIVHPEDMQGTITVVA